MEFKFNERLRKIRMSRGLYQADLANLMNIEPYNISNWEQGRAEPCIEDIRKLCQVLKISADKLLDVREDDYHNDLLDLL